MCTDWDQADRLATAVHLREEGAFERLVELYEGSLFRYTERLVENAHDAQEVVQDAFLRAHRALTRQYDEARCRELNLKPWLFRIARNLAFNKKRGKMNRLQIPLPILEDDDLRGLTRGEVPNDFEKREEMRELDRAISGLPSEYRELIVLRFLEEMSYAEISRTTGSNEASLRGKVFRSLKLLREALGSKGVAHAMS
ncbi:MAG: RNA polymerase sigma factor [Acidobacteriota bacterium]